MAINSLYFLLFFLPVFFLYYLRLKEQNGKWQNFVLLISSYIFYGIADIRMLPLVVGITALFFILGILIEKNEDKKAADWYLLFSIIAGVGILVYFKYTNFFISSIIGFMKTLGINCDFHTLDIIMPLGISFFVFRLLSYTIDIHRGMIAASKDAVSFAAFVAFFPCMLSGPIDRPASFMQQLEKERKFNEYEATTGLRQILWGGVKKMVIADTLAIYVNKIFSCDSNASCISVLIATIFYTFQIYADFSGYSDMAIGVGRLLGIKVTKNFNYPFFAKNIADFWHKWHISLTSWATDYIFTPLNYSFRKYRIAGCALAIVINFTIIGLWHGANWNYVIYGIYHGFLFIPLLAMGALGSDNTIKTNRLGMPVLKDFIQIILTFVLVAFGMLIFRSTDMHVFSRIMSQLFSLGSINIDSDILLDMILILSLLFFEWMQRDKEFALDFNVKITRPIRWCIYIFLILLIFVFSSKEQLFIYQVF